LLLPENSIDALLKHTYPDIQRPQTDHYFRDRCILCPRNRDCHELNDLLLEQFPGDAVELWAID
ncbi:hypothetical protein EDB86DRAFT_2768809, partial [Lactarius hatsudake]